VAVLIAGVAGAVPFAFYYGIRNRTANRVDRAQAAAVLGAVALTAVALAVSMRLGSGVPWRRALAEAPLLGCSAQATSGFEPVPVAGLGTASRWVLVASMTVGGGAGSTAGGFKVLRLLVLFRALGAAVTRSAMPRHAVRAPRMAGRPLDATHDISPAACLLLATVLLVVGSGWVLMLAGHDPLASLFEAASALGTVGLSSGITRPGLPTHLKAVLCVDMLAGRLEILAWLVVLWRGTWFGRRRRKA